MHTEYPHNISEETALLAASKLYSYLKNDTSISFSDEEIRKAIHATQVMIDIHLKHLVTLRITCDLNQIIKQNDIRFLEVCLAWFVYFFIVWVFCLEQIGSAF